MSTKADTALLPAEQCCRVLAGHPPEVQGAVLADLLATWLAGHNPPELREDLLRLHLRTVRQMLAEHPVIVIGPAKGRA